MSAARDLKNSIEFMQLATSRQNCRKVQRVIVKNMQIIRIGYEPKAVPLAQFMQQGVSFRDWRLAAKARRELHEKKSSHEKRMEMLEAHKKQAREAQARKYGYRTE